MSTSSPSQVSKWQFSTDLIGTPFKDPQSKGIFGKPPTQPKNYFEA